MGALTTHDPAIAAAMSRCLAARTLAPDRPFIARHLSRCGWCAYELADLNAAVAEFTAWADFSAKHGTSGQLAIRRFGDLPRAEQEAQIVDAQALDGEERRTETLGLERPAPSNPVPEVEQEEISPWLA